MNNIEKIISQIKQLKQNQCGINEQGKLLIKIENHSFHRTDKKKSSSKKNMQYTGILHPDHSHLIRKNISIWIDELIIKIEKFFDADFAQYNQIDIVLNQTALVLCLIGKYDLAKKICIQHIELFYKLSLKDPILLKHMIQPWVNLGRIDRLLGNFNKALDKFHLLTLLKENANPIIINNHMINPKAMLQAIESDTEIKTMIVTCAVLEPIKTNIKSEQYREVIALVNQLVLEKKSNLLGIGYEAFVIAETQQDHIDRALDIIDEAMEELPIHVEPIFYLRQSELLAIQGDSHTELAFKRVVNYLISLNKELATYSLTLLAVTTAQQILKFGFQELSTACYKKALDFAFQISDEPFIIACLKALSDLTVDLIYKNQLHDMLSRCNYTTIMKPFPNIKNISVDTKRNTLLNQLSTYLRRIKC